ncbi:helix-turn-helix transcriptional regulator [Maritimibacter sp. UBA3975]|uniref:helix-turn-helix domain-containing protein n=1 Tax=Maritimibacter sp. UBA3975 TaxID=1946833 RepID=UPI000C0B0EB2|nr:helix-turn-helix transcriptional regulator [Maritimibacter sp. UBA3975]MAM62298.1 transcriptional regulator [Maritimibacter sp.]|tara:strand:- start:8249 stop:9097 length:849 start_codon:yes stop_codon:yes gene_type:complete
MKVDKRDRATLFRERLISAMTVAGASRAGIARSTGVNRSTISQVLDAGAARLPSAQLTADLAQELGVSTDWLLGLTDRPERPGDAIEAAVQMTEADRTSADEQLLDWYREAAGYKVRHVPATLPDMLKTEPMMRWEYEGFLAKTTDQAISAMRERLDVLRTRSSDHEIALPVQEFTAFAAGEGYYRGVPRKVRQEQLDHFAALHHEFYPSLRVFLYDSRRVFSAPITIYGPLVGVIYVGRIYLAFRESSRLRSLVEHFDWLVREAEVDARDFGDYVAGLTVT